jgi:hypothetical protein
MSGVHQRRPSLPSKAYAAAAGGRKGNDVRVGAGMGTCVWPKMNLVGLGAGMCGIEFTQSTTTSFKLS